MTPLAFWQGLWLRDAMGLCHAPGEPWWKCPTMALLPLMLPGAVVLTVLRVRIATVEGGGV